MKNKTIKTLIARTLRICFTVIAKNNSADNPCIQSATLNGKLVLTMGPTPNKAFGSAMADRLPKI